MTEDIQIADRTIGAAHPPFIIAELSGNHNNDLNRALALVDAAADAGADAVKLQTYTADTMTLDIDSPEFRIEGGLWDGRTLYDLYAEASTPWDWHSAIFDRAHARGLICFSSPFDETAVDFLESLDAPAYKIASLELTDTELIARVSRTGKPVIMSTGTATIAEIDEAVSTARQAGCRDIVLLRCTSAYPAQPADANLRTIPVLQSMFNCQVGLSDHTLGTHIPVAAVALGATVIEKHFTLSRADGGVDSAFSLEPSELANLRRHTQETREALGKPKFGSLPSEQNASKHRRSLYIVEDLKPGDVLTDQNIRALRPAGGLHVRFRHSLIGKRVTVAVERGTPMDWPLILQSSKQESS
jgi:pseudaminic acid synthase